MLASPQLMNSLCFLHAQPSTCPWMTEDTPMLPACAHMLAARPGGPFPSSAGQLLPSQLHARFPGPSCQLEDFLWRSVRGLRGICQWCCERELGIHCSTSHTDKTAWFPCACSLPVLQPSPAFTCHSISRAMPRHGNTETKVLLSPHWMPEKRPYPWSLL